MYFFTMTILVLSCNVSKDIYDDAYDQAELNPISKIDNDNGYSDYIKSEEHKYTVDPDEDHYSYISEEKNNSTAVGSLGGQPSNVSQNDFNYFCSYHNIFHLHSHDSYFCRDWAYNTNPGYHLTGGWGYNNWGYNNWGYNNYYGYNNHYWPYHHHHHHHNNYWGNNYYAGGYYWGAGYGYGYGNGWNSPWYNDPYYNNNNNNNIASNNTGGGGSFTGGSDNTYYGHRNGKSQGTSSNNTTTFENTVKTASGNHRTGPFPLISDDHVAVNRPDQKIIPTNKPQLNNQQPISKPTNQQATSTNKRVVATNNFQRETRSNQISSVKINFT